MPFSTFLLFTFPPLPTDIWVVLRRSIGSTTNDYGDGPLPLHVHPLAVCNHRTLGPLPALLEV